MKKKQWRRRGSYIGLFVLLFSTCISGTTELVEAKENQSVLSEEKQERLTKQIEDMVSIDSLKGKQSALTSSTPEVEPITETETSPSEGTSSEETSTSEETTETKEIQEVQPSLDVQEEESETESEIAANELASTSDEVESASARYGVIPVGTIGWTGSFKYRVEGDRTVTLLEYAGTSPAVTIPAGVGVPWQGAAGVMGFTAVTTKAFLQHLVSKGVKEIYWQAPVTINETNNNGVTITPGTYTARLRGDFSWTFNQTGIQKVNFSNVQWGDNSYYSDIVTRGMFANTSSLHTVAGPMKVRNPVSMFENSAVKWVLTDSGGQTSINGDASRMFFNCGQLQTVNTNTGEPYFDISSVTNLSSMFARCVSLNGIDFVYSNRDSGFGVPTTSMFEGCTKMGWITNPPKVKNGSRMFMGCSNLQTVNKNNGQSFELSGDVSSMFNGCIKLMNLIINNNVGSPLQIGTVFGDRDGVTNTAFMFYNCQNLPAVTFKNFAAMLDFDASKVIYMQGMFQGCKNLQSIDFGTKFVTSNVQDMSNMFHGCSNLTTLDLSVFNTGNVQNMTQMFNLCTKLNTLKIQNFNTANVKSMQGMFANCTSLLYLNLAHFNTTNVLDMSYMFQGSTNLSSLNVEHFNTSKVTSMSHMFHGTNIEAINLTSFDINSATDLTSMFGSNSTKQLYVIAKDHSRLLSYNYSADNRIPPKILFEANGGEFADGSTTKNYFTTCAITLYQASGPAVKQFMTDNRPTRSNRDFQGWKLKQGVDVNSMAYLEQMFGTIYEAKWNSFGLVQVPTAKTFSGSLNKGTVNIPASGTSNKLGVLDESSDNTAGWKLYAQLVWTNAPNTTTKISTQSTGSVDEISPSGSTSLAPAGLVTTDTNLEINTAANVVMEGNKGHQAFNGTYVTELGTMILELSEGSHVATGQTYNGAINWNLTLVP